MIKKFYVYSEGKAVHFEELADAFKAFEVAEGGYVALGVNYNCASADMFKKVEGQEPNITTEFNLTPQAVRDELMLEMLKLVK